MVEVHWRQLLILVEHNAHGEVALGNINEMYLVVKGLLCSLVGIRCMLKQYMLNNMRSIVQDNHGRD